MLLAKTCMAQYEMPLPPAQVQVIESGSLIIPMDTVNQKMPGYFNLKAYGLVNRLLQSEIPVKWAIKSGKTKLSNSTSIDFQATCNRVFPDTTAPANTVYRSGCFIIDKEWVPVATPFISQFGNNVAVYILNANTSIDIRYKLTFKPKISLLNTSGFDTITVHVLQEAGYDASSYQLSLPAGKIFNPSDQFSLVSDAHYTNGDTAHVNPVLCFVSSYGGNFIANCTAQGTYENNSFTMTTAGIDTIPTSITALVYSNNDLPIAQFQGGLRVPHGEYKYWRMKSGSTFRSTAYNVMTGTSTSPMSGIPLKIVAGTKLKPASEKGGNIYYLSGHDFYYYTQPGSPNENDRINGRRIFLNSTLIPPHDTIGLDFTTDIALGIDATVPAVKDEVCTVTVSVTNLKGGTAKGVMVTAPLPAGLSYLSHSTTYGSFNPATGVWTIGNVPKNTFYELTIATKITQLNTIVYPASAVNSALEEVKTNNSDTLIISPMSRPVAVNDTTPFTGPYAVDMNTKMNDSDEDGGPFGNAFIASGPFNGSATILNSDVIRYVPNASFTGMDSLLYVTCDNYPLCDSAWLFINVITPLPVELSRFGGKRTNGMLYLNWITLSEKENDHFDIEESVDGKSFSRRGSVKGAGTSIEINEYDFSDVDDKNNTVCYYRLRQFDFNGDEHLSHVIALKRNYGDMEFLLAPNPVDKTGALIVQSSLEDHETALFTISDIAGRVIYSRAVAGNPDGCTVIHIPAGMEAGCYYAALATSFSKAGCRLIIR